MHDPSTLAHSIKRPWPKIRVLNGRELEKYGSGFHWQIRPFGYVSPFIYIFGRELYFPAIIEIWHTDPLGDSGPACHGRKHWKWHFNHMRIRLSFWYDFLQAQIDRCAWCGKKSTGKMANGELGRVNHSDGRATYHSACLDAKNNAYHAHDPNKCWNCEQNTKVVYLPLLQRYMPAEQYRIVESLRMNVDLGFMGQETAIAIYNKRKRAARWL